VEGGYLKKIEKHGSNILHLLKSCKNLVFLCLDISVDIAHLPVQLLGKLEQLECHEVITENQMKPILSLLNLKSLTISDAKQLTIKMLLQSKHLRLNKIALFHSTLPVLIQFTGFLQLKVLSLIRCNVTNTHCIAIAQIASQLTKLTLGIMDLNSYNITIITSISQMPNLKLLNILYTNVVDFPTYDEKIFENLEVLHCGPNTQCHHQILSQNKNLNELYIYKSVLDSSMFYTNTVKKLTLSHCTFNVTNSGIFTLGKMQYIKIIYCTALSGIQLIKSFHGIFLHTLIFFKCDDIPYEAVSNIANQLYSLTLKECKTTNANLIMILKKCGKIWNIIELNLAKSEIDDSGISKLMYIKIPRLRTLNIEDTKISKRMRTEFKHSYPLLVC